MSKKSKDFSKALAGKILPVLTLDNTWHQLFTQAETTEEIEGLTEELNKLLSRQGKLISESKSIHAIKKKLLDEIVELQAQNGGNPSEKNIKKLDEKKRLINECNEKLDDYADELKFLPGKIEDTNKALMVASMEACYEFLDDNEREIETIDHWVSQVRIDLKKNIIRKQEKEEKNRQLYQYMHDIFGAEVIDIFDMTYNPAEKYKKKDD